MKDVRLSIAIMHAPLRPERTVLLHDLLRSLGPSEEAVRSQLDAFEVVVDPVGEGPWPTSKRAWRAGMRSGSTHHLVLQDDTAVCRDFIAGAKAALAAIPDGLVSFYFTRRKAMESARDAGSSWLTTRAEVYGTSLCMPTPWIDDFLRWEWAHISPDLYHDDTRFTLYSYVNKLGVWCTVPSLVDHVGRAVSTIPGHEQRYGYKSTWFLGQDASALDIDWTRGLPVPPREMSTQYAPLVKKRWYHERVDRTEGRHTIRRPVERPEDA